MANDNFVVTRKGLTHEKSVQKNNGRNTGNAYGDIITRKFTCGGGGVKAASPSEATTEYETASPSNASYQDEEAVVSDAGKIETVEDKAERSEKSETESPLGAEPVAFKQSRTIDDVTVTVTADAGVFPEGARLEVSKVTDKKDLKEIDAAVEEARDEEKSVASSYTLDIQILDKDNNEIQPNTEKGTVNVKFSMAEKLNEVLDVAVYHVAEATPSEIEEAETRETDEDGILLDGKLTDDVTEEAENAEEESETTEKAETPYKAETLETEIKEKKNSTEIIVETEGFSVYVVEFTYGELQYVLEGDTSVKLSEIQEKIGLSGKVTSAEVSNDELFTVTKDKEGEDWTVTALKAFSTEEWLKVTMGEQTYEILVTDEQQEISENPDQIEIQIGETYTYKVSILRAEYKTAPKVTIESTGRPIFSLEETHITQFKYISGSLVGGTCLTTVTITGTEPGTSTVYLKYNSEIVDERTITVKSSFASINYELDGGENDPSNPVEYDGTIAYTLKKPTKKGYDFSGWYKEESFTNKITQIEKTDNPQDITIYAKWTPISYTVKFDGNGSTSGSMANQSRKYDDKKALTANAFKRTGYTFNGWNTQADGKGTAFSNKATSNIRSTAGTTTLYAQWKKDTYTIKYELNGGKNSTSNPSSYDVTTATITLQSPTRTGYTFGGWYSDSKWTKQVKTIAKGSTGNKTLYAKWTANAYKIAFNANGGTGTAPKTISTAYGKIVTLTANPFKKTGYSFAGWATSKTGEVKYKDKASVKNLSSKSGATVTLYAQWKVNSYKIAFNANGGTGTAPTTISTAYGKTVTLTANPFKRTGYSFTGWNTKADGKGTKYANKASVKNLTSSNGKTVTLYAQWSKTKYTITYKLDGGKNNSKNPASYYVTTADIKLQNPTKTGYSFDGWYSDSKLTKKATTTIKKGSTGNKTFYAKWKINTYKITYNLNGGKNSSKNPASYKVTTSDIKLQNPTKTGYTFGGWYSDSKFKTKVTTIKKGSTGNKTLYAKWTTNKYTIAFNANGGSGSMSKMTGIAYGSSKTLTANKFTRKNYTFQGWSTSKTGDVKYKNKASVKNLSSKNGATVTLYAIWKVDTYTIAFNANGGSGSMSKLTVGVTSSKALTANAFKKTGYTFAGWSTSKTGSVKYKNKATVKGLTTKGKTVTLYAVWKANKYTIAFNGNGSTSGSMKNLAATYDKKVTLTANAFKKKNYIFDGWNTKADGSGTSYKNKASVSNLSSKSGATVTLYAQWKAEKPPITVSVQNPSRTQFEYTNLFPTRWVSTVNLDNVDVIANHTGDNKNSISVTVTGTVIDIAKNHKTGYACYCILKKKNGEEYTRLAPYFKEAYAGKAFESTVIFKDIIDGEYTIELTDADGYASAY